jgi:hypothetical protein
LSGQPRQRRQEPCLRGKGGQRKRVFLGDGGDIFPSVRSRFSPIHENK